jgi:hypothetical protein
MVRTGRVLGLAASLGVASRLDILMELGVLLTETVEVDARKFLKMSVY